MKIQKAISGNIEAVLAIMDMARAYQRSLGFKQWEDGYPNREIIEADIDSGDAYIFTIEGKIVGYALLQIGDSAYDELTDVWAFEGEYGVVHRLAFDDSIRGQGYSTKAFQLIEANFRSRTIDFIRIDTGEKNIVMQHILERCGYKSRGTRNFPWGSRVAFEKNISQNND